MTALTRAARAWLNDKDHSEPGIQIRVVDIPSGRALSYQSGVQHIVADAIEVSDDNSTVLAAAWICGSISVRVAVTDDDAHPAQCTSCRLAAALPQCPVVYYAWGEDDELLYVGSTVKAHQRIRAHMTQTRWWPEVKRLSFDECETEIECRTRESEAILTRPGTHNRGGVVRDNLAAVVNMIDNLHIDRGGAA